jgi:PAS domain S-box-containing protein
LLLEVNGPTIPILAALIVQLALALVVFQSNWHRKSNQCFFFLSLAAAGWLGSLYLAFVATDQRIAALAIREASSAAVLILATLNLLRITLRRNRESWTQILKRSRLWLIGTLAVVFLCHTSFFLKGARIAPGGGAAAEPVYGHDGVFAYSLYLALSAIILIISSWRDLRKTTGGHRAELAFTMFGGLFAAVFPLLLTLILESFSAPLHLLWLAPFRVVLFSAVVAYGIATKKIMEVGNLIRRIISYTLLGAYLLALYALVWWLVSMALPSSTANAHSIAHIAAAIVIAFAMAPARGVSQRLAERLFISAQRLDFRATVGNAAAILKSVTTLRDLLERFAQTIAQAANTERVIILLAQKDSYTQYYPAPTRHSQIELPKDHPILNYLKSSGQPIVLDELHRIRPTAEVHRIINQMQHLDLAVVMGIFARDQLEGVMLLGPRISGHIYGSLEQEALQVLCGQLAVAIENAQLFTEVQNAKIYNETLLENLTTGVIAVGADERITVFNNEAEQITGLNSHVVLGHPLADLPGSLGRVLRETLQTGQGRVNHEVALGSDSKEMIARTSTSIFHDQDQQMLGALMVLTDITVLKQLEAQIRRSDRLASLGTLSAGMAHEIKNPLVSIKTFAQLLPERYQDSDFRETFSNLIGHEIDRIDSLVNQLLRFARPTKPLLKPVHVHEVLEKSLNLLGHRLYQKEIKLARSLQANVDTIRADADQLEQVFLNFFLNAMDAMKKGGELAVTTQVQTDERWIAAITRSNGESGEVLHITIRDTGEGIRKEDIPHVFDPFFTTKDYGTGLGLSVVHGIIQEHGGQIEVESEVQKGTAFHILLPLARFDSKVAVA